MQPIRIEVFRSKGLLKRRGWYVRLRSTNGRVILTSESYSTRWNAQRCADRLSFFLKQVTPEIVLTQVT